MQPSRGLKPRLIFERYTMVKTDKNFRLHKSYKRLLASYTGKMPVFELKNMFIDEQVTFERQKRMTRKEKVAPEPVDA